MTPMLLAFMKRGLKSKRFIHYDEHNRAAVNLWGRLSGVQTFECTEVKELIDDVVDKEIDEGIGLDFSETFLPASKTWIELKLSGCRFAFFLEERPDTSICVSTINYGLHEDIERKVAGSDREAEFFLLKDSFYVRPSVFTFSCFSSAKIFDRVSNYSRATPEDSLLDLSEQEDMHIAATRAYAALALINTPKIIGRRQHMPHRGLERELLKRRGVMGHFPLQAWTEIKLEVGKTEDVSGAPSVEAHLTGERALHFCRAHLRVRMGKVEFVRGHWRGDASLGIKRSRYKVTPASG
ncbi:hypothetical protein [Rhizobium sp. G21]|uniref:hypothetical protein n=1 Tax=Rhizobium sp. G21 TaxID=2758439 RepID=UPI0015FFF675|nr:hypothetical protein [Rhizobium sp. G21]MBB1247438.1 hypothetical protein [Rhizobium sp. G21]